VIPARASRRLRSAGLLLALGAALSAAHAEDDGEAKGSTPHPRVEMRDGRAELSLPAELQTRIGLEVRAASAAQYRPEELAFAEVLDATELLRARDDYRQRRLELDAAGAALAAEEAQIARLESMHKQGALVAPGELHQARQNALQLRARQSQAANDLDGVLGRVRYAWNAVLAEHLKDPHDTLLDDLAAGRQSLLAIGLGSDRALPEGVGEVSIAARAERATATATPLLGPTPRAARWLGPTFLAVSPAPELRIGSQPAAWIASSAAPLTGVEIAGTAAVWHGGRQWAYVRRGTDTFERRAIAPRPSGSGRLFLEQGVAAGEEVVVQGAATLLAEEFRWAIPEENAD
jgi:hypothetical protein